MMNTHLNYAEKEKIIQNIIDCYILVQRDLMVQKNNLINDFCWNVFESLNSLNGEEKRFIIDYFFNSVRTSKENSKKGKIKVYHQAMERFLEKIELKW